MRGSRWTGKGAKLVRRRPSAPEPSPYITRAGYEALQAELRNLWKHTRPALVQRVAEAAAMGDRSENAEYIYGKKQLRETDRRIAYLSKRLDKLKVVERAPPDRTKVFFGACVELAQAGGEAAGLSDGLGKTVRRYRLVGPDEADAAAGRLSIDAPLARALLHKSVGALVAFDGENWFLAAVRYGDDQVAESELE